MLYVLACSLLLWLCCVLWYDGDDDGDSASDKICVALNVLNSLSTAKWWKDVEKLDIRIIAIAKWKGMCDTIFCCFNVCSLDHNALWICAYEWASICGFDGFSHLVVVVVFFPLIFNFFYINVFCHHLFHASVDLGEGLVVVTLLSIYYIASWSNDEHFIFPFWYLLFHCTFVFLCVHPFNHFIIFD